ncbi:MAG: hypothetical protein ABIG86_01380 [Patescibacteria group bacterium]
MISPLYRIRVICPNFRNRKIYLLGFLAILISSSLLFVSKSEKDPEILVNEPLVASASESQTEYNLKVLFVSINPVENDQDLMEKYYGWVYPGKTTKEAEDLSINANIASMKRLSNHKINYKVVKRLDIASFPKRTGTFQYTFDNYKICTDQATNGPCEVEKHNFDHVDWATSNNICGIAEENDIDEIWMASPPFVATWENFMIGPKSEDLFNVNGGIYVIPKCRKNYIVMSSGTSDRFFGHIYGHRVEQTMQYITRWWDSTDRENYWERFARYLFYAKPMNVGLALGDPPFCGNSHFPSNATSHYDYANKSFSKSICGDWKNIPNFTGDTITVNCEAWNCNDSNSIGGWAEYWMGSIPREEGYLEMESGVGRVPFRMKKDWWYYLLYPENVVQLVADMSAVSAGEFSCSITLDVTNSPPVCQRTLLKEYGSVGEYKEQFEITHFPTTIEVVIHGYDSDGCSDLQIGRNDGRRGSAISFTDKTPTNPNGLDTLEGVLAFTDIGSNICQSNTFMHTYDTPGIYRIWATIFDNDNEIGSCNIVTPTIAKVTCESVDIIPSNGQAFGKKGRYNFSLNYSPKLEISGAKFEVHIANEQNPVVLLCLKSALNDNCVFYDDAGKVEYRNYLIEKSGDISVIGFVQDASGVLIQQ